MTCGPSCQALRWWRLLVRFLTRQQRSGTFWEMVMLHYAVVFLVIALVAAIFGFGGIAAGAVGIAKILFFVFVIMAVVTFVFGLLKRG
jgi:uncharacterized membrane protein YtjA (UPF0391 family)